MDDELTGLATAARRGDQGAMREFIRISRREVWSLCAHLVDAQSADDLTQEVYIRVFRSLKAFRRDSSARTWLLTIAQRTCMDELRSRVRQRRRDAQLTDLYRQQPVASDVAEQIEVQVLLSRLDADRRMSFVLTQLIGLSYEEAARVCGCPVGTIRSRVARARSDLIEALNADTAATPVLRRAGGPKAEVVASSEPADRRARSGIGAARPAATRRSV